MKHDFTKKQIDRFWSNVNIGEIWDCWEWKLSTDRYGYGKVKIVYGVYIAHRVAYEAYHGFIPDGKHILHSCDNPLCCNPNHLHAGTHTENMQDMEAKGRRSQKGTCNRKMNFERATMLRNDFKTGATKKALSRKYNISPRSVRDIIRGEYWKTPSSLSIESQ